MTDTLLKAVRRYAEAYADPAGVARTPIAGLTTIRATAPSDLDYAISRPLACLVLQGTKHVTMGNRAFTFSAGDSLLITADVPTVSRITRASIAVPYFSLVLDLDPAVIADLAVEMKAVPMAKGVPVHHEPTDAEVTDAALRLMRLIGARRRCQCCARSWCVRCTTGSWPGGTGRRSDALAGRTVMCSVWRARSRRFEPNSLGHCGSRGSRLLPG